MNGTVPSSWGCPMKTLLLEQCIDLFTGSSLPLFYTDCVHPT
jgi:hypothetical protein